MYSLQYTLYIIIAKTKLEIWLQEGRQVFLSLSKGKIWVQKWRGYPIVYPVPNDFDFIHFVVQFS